MSSILVGGCPGFLIELDKVCPGFFKNCAMVNTLGANGCGPIKTWVNL
jgi:hypothetical protein